MDLILISKTSRPLDPKPAPEDVISVELKTDEEESSSSVPFLPHYSLDPPPSENVNRDALTLIP
jgi:hypothetical protein